MVQLNTGTSWIQTLQLNLTRDETVVALEGAREERSAWRGRATGLLWWSWREHPTEGRIQKEGRSTLKENACNSVYRAGGGVSEPPCRLPRDGLRAWPRPRSEQRHGVTLPLPSGIKEHLEERKLTGSNFLY